MSSNVINETKIIDLSSTNQDIMQLIEHLTNQQVNRNSFFITYNKIISKLFFI